MDFSYLNPVYLPIVPPMDLNQESSDVDKLSRFPMKLRTYKGLFGARRDEDPGLIRMHEGVDLLAPLGEPVYAAASGRVVSVGDSTILIQHDIGVRFATYYQHVRNQGVRVDALVKAGQRIAEVGPFDPNHLHFEIRYAFSSTTEVTRATSLPVDATSVLYQWETKMYPNDADARKGRKIENATIDSFEEVWRGRLRFILLGVSGTARNLFIPLIDQSDQNLRVLDTAKQAFFSSKRVRIVWRPSLFFSEIEGAHDMAAIVTEIRVLR